jgi:hypothetical protein
MSEATVERRRPWRRRVAVGSALLATTIMSVGFTMVAEATGGGSTTNVAFVPLATPYKLLTSKSFAANTSDSVVVIGGSTTVPSNATTVRLSVEAGGTTAGTMNFTPKGNLVGGSGQYLSWSAGGSDTQNIAENVGLSDELTFALSGGAAKVTATITGYSTQVTDGDISPADGTSGQVLTNSGSGASWQGPSGGPGYTEQDSNDFTLNNYSYANVASLTLPAGDYALSFTGDAANFSASSDNVECYVLSSNTAIAFAATTVEPHEDLSLATEVMVSTSGGGTYTVGCFDSNNLGDTFVGYSTNPTFNAIELSSANGTVQSDHPVVRSPRGVAALRVPKAG